MNIRSLAVMGCLVASLAAAPWGSAAEKEHGHKAAHGGCLNAIEECAVGHVETKVEDGTLSVWLVGGDGATETAVRVTAGEIPLLVTVDGGDTVRALTLVAKPLALAEETPGDCSHFVAEADWLKTAKHFSAVGFVKFKGALRVLRIDYPEGFDPDHDHDDDHDHGHGHGHGHKAEKHGKK